MDSVHEQMQLQCYAECAKYRCDNCPAGDKFVFCDYIEQQGLQLKPLENLVEEWYSCFFGEEATKKILETGKEQ